MAAPRTTVEITDPRALRALAHPARQRIIAELYAGEVLTATQAGRLVGLTASATSYHLRALETWGVVVRDAATGDARERPWRAAADSLTITAGAHAAAGPVASGLVMRSWLTDLEAGLGRLATAVTEGEEPGLLNRGRLWLTPQERAEVRKSLDEVLAAYRHRTSREHPPGAAAYEAYALLLPVAPPPP